MIFNSYMTEFYLTDVYVYTFEVNVVAKAMNICSLYYFWDASDLFSGVFSPGRRIKIISSFSFNNWPVHYYVF